MAANHAYNEAHKLKAGNPKYKVSNHAELAAIAIGGKNGKSMLNRIIGPAKAGTPVNFVKKSAFLNRIRDAMEIPRPIKTSIEVRADRAAAHRVLESLPDGVFDSFIRGLNQLTRE